MFQKKTRIENKIQNGKKKEQKMYLQSDMNRMYEDQVKKLKGDELIDFLLNTAIVINDDSMEYEEKQQEFLRATGDKNNQLKVVHEVPENNQDFLPQKNCPVYKKFNYKRISYFKDLLLNIQAKEGKEIPSSLIEKIEKELKLYRKTFEDLDYDLTKKILKDINESKFYKNIYSIINITNKRKRIVIPQDIHDKLCFMFEFIQESYERNKGNRESFLNYNYTLYKFFEILRYNEFLYIFPKLKNAKKIEDHDEIWEKVCRDTGLPFYPTTNL